MVALLTSADDAPPTLAIPRRPAEMPRPRIDGVLDDPIWQVAGVIDSLRQSVPIAGGEPSEHTEVLLAYDSNSIYLGLRCFDSDPAEIRATQRTRDARLNPDDRIEFVIDSFNDQRNAFWFQIGAGGSEGDALIGNNGAAFNKPWDGIWNGKSTIDERGWFAECEIPLATLTFDPETSVFGFNIRRHIRRRNEEVRWSSPTPRISFFSIANAGKLTGLGGLEQGLGLDVVPFAVADYQLRRDDRRSFLTGDAGLDAFYKLTPNFKLSVSFNTDFAETEVDERQVNLTRFPLFFPEQRDFFLEDTSVFNFGGDRSRNVIPFFSRRIGIDSGGGEVPLLAAAKLTGRTDDYAVGLLDVQIDDQDDLQSKNLFVGRYQHNLFEQSQAGVIYTRGDPSSRSRNDTFGADFAYRTNDFLGDRNLNFTSWFLRADSADIDDDENAYSASVSLPNDQWDLSASFLSIEEEFDPALGFVPRPGTRRYNANAEIAPRWNKWGLRQAGPEFSASVITDTGNDIQTTGFNFSPLKVEMDSADEFEISIERTREVLGDSFEIVDDIVIPVDTYDWMRYGARLESSTHRPIVVEGGFEFGGFFGGKREDARAEVRWQPSALGSIAVEYSRNGIRVPNGSFVVRVTRLRLNVALTPRLTWSSFAQFDNVSDVLGLNSRIWWIIEPGRQFFFVLNQGWDWQVSEGRFGATDTQLTAKLGYTVRF